MFKKENHSFVKFVPGIFVVYLSVPKVASSAISHALLSACPSATDDIEEHSIIGKCLTNWRPAYSPRPGLPIFTYVRDPIAKFISFYKDKFLKGREGGFELAALDRLGFLPGMSIDEVVRHMVQIPVGKMEHHAQPQYRILAPRGRYLPDFTGHVEAIADTWQHIRSVSLYDFNIETNRNATSGNQGHDLCEESLSALALYYAADFKILGYEAPVSASMAAHGSRDSTGGISERHSASIRSTLLRSNQEFIALSEKLHDHDFRDSYVMQSKALFNDYLVFSNFRTSRRSISMFFRK